MKQMLAALAAVVCALFFRVDCFAVGADAAVLIDGTSGRVLFEQDKDERLPMASTTKIMTALIVLEQSGIDEWFTVNPKSIMVEGSSMGLQRGDRATLRVLAAGMLLASGNDAANAAAVRVSGSTAEFAALMNERAAELGMVNTSFETPSGLDGENHYSTAYDMALLARAALGNDDFAELCAAKSLALEYGAPPYRRWLTNHNRLLTLVEGATGVKTGFTKRAGRCLVSSVKRDGMELICVTLACPDDWNTHRNLYDEYFAKLEPVNLAEMAGDFYVPVIGGEATAVPAKAAAVVVGLFEGEADRVAVELELEATEAPVLCGKKIGTVVFSLDGTELAKADILAQCEVPGLPRPPTFWELLFEKLGFARQ